LNAKTGKEATSRGQPGRSLLTATETKHAQTAGITKAAASLQTYGASLDMTQCPTCRCYLSCHQVLRKKNRASI